MSVIKFRLGLNIVDALTDALTEAVEAVNLDVVGEREASYEIESVDVRTIDEDLFEVTVRTVQVERRATNDEQREVILDELGDLTLEIPFSGEPGEAGWWVSW